MKFDKLAYQAKHNAQVSALRGAEKTVRAILSELSREVLVAVHHDGDISWANKVLGALTPVNRKVAVQYFRAFLGFKFSDEKGEFIAKDKKAYDEAQAASVAFIEDPLNNIWTWAERNIEIEVKEFDIVKLNKQVAALTKKMKDANISNLELLKAAFANGVTIEDMIAMMDHAGYDAKVE